MLNPMTVRLSEVMSPDASLAGVPEADPARVAASYLYTGVQIIEEVGPDATRR